MRLRVKDVEFIRQAAKENFGEQTDIYLFGSRVFDDKKGGDIYLYLETTEKNGIFEKKIKLLKLLYQRLG